MVLKFRMGRLKITPKLNIEYDYSVITQLVALPIVNGEGDWLLPSTYSHLELYFDLCAAYAGHG
jgi:hypothetical protein